MISHSSAEETPSPSAFISYSHDGEEHCVWVEQLAHDLQARGIYVILDRWDLGPGHDIARFMETGVTDADRVVLVCSERYTQKASEGSGGVGYERTIVTAELIADSASRKFIPILRRNAEGAVPAFLGSRLHVDFRDDSKYANNVDALAKEILGVPRGRPPLGTNPYARQAGPVDRRAPADENPAAWDQAKAKDRVLQELQLYAREHDFGLGHPSSRSATSVSHEVQDFFYVSYFDRPAYVAVAVTRAEPPDRCHAAAPKLSFFEFLGTPSGWQLRGAYPNVLHVGAWGDPPHSIRVMEIGYNLFGVAIEGGFTNQGATTSYTTIHAMVAGEFKQVFECDTYESDSGTGRPSRNEWSTTIKVDRSGTGFYDLAVRRTGVQKGKRIDESVLYRFDGRTYVPGGLYQ